MYIGSGPLYIRESLLIDPGGAVPGSGHADAVLLARWRRHAVQTLAILVSDQLLNLCGQTLASLSGFCCALSFPQA